MNAAYAIAAILLTVALVLGYLAARTRMSSHAAGIIDTATYLTVGAVLSFLAALAFAGVGVGIQY